MRQAGFEYIVKAGVILSREELDILIELATSHYDDVCRSITASGKDAFLYWMRNEFLFAEQQGRPVTEVTVYLTEREISTMLKVLEARPQLDLAERLRRVKVDDTSEVVDAIVSSPLEGALSDRRQVADQLADDLHRAFRAMGDEWKRLNVRAEA